MNIKRARIINKYKGTPDEVYANKIFFLSMAFAIPFIVFFLLLINKFDFCNRYWTILIIGIIIEFGNVISTIYWISVTRRQTS